MNYYDYEGIDPNYPEVEEIIENATGEFSKFLHEAFVDEYKAIETAKQNNTAKEHSLTERSIELNNKERELEKREAEIVKKEDAIYGKLKQEWYESLGMQFDVGDTVYYCKELTKSYICPICNGKEKVKVKVGVTEYEVNCPECRGWGKKKKEYSEVIEATVDEIEVKIRKSKDSMNVVRHNYTCSGEHLISYIRIKEKESGQYECIDIKKLYKTKQEAESHIAKLEKASDEQTKRN